MPEWGHRAGSSYKTAKLRCNTSSRSCLDLPCLALPCSVDTNFGHTMGWDSCWNCPITLWDPIRYELLSSAKPSSKCPLGGRHNSLHAGNAHCMHARARADKTDTTR